MAGSVTAGPSAEYFDEFGCLSPEYEIGGSTNRSGYGLESSLRMSVEVVDAFRPEYGCEAMSVADVADGNNPEMCDNHLRVKCKYLCSCTLASMDLGLLETKSKRSPGSKWELYEAMRGGSTAVYVWCRGDIGSIIHSRRIKKIEHMAIRTSVHNAFKGSYREANGRPNISRREVKRQGSQEVDWGGDEDSLAVIQAIANNTIEEQS